MDWSGSILLGDSSKLEDITISTAYHQTPISLPNGASLRFLSMVDISRIPLYLAVDKPYSVSTSNVDTERWFSYCLLSYGDGIQNGWWDAARPDSPFGILAAVEGRDASMDAFQPCLTEILFYATQCRGEYPTPLSPPPSSPNPGVEERESKREATLSLNALALSSEILLHAQEAQPTPPASPLSDRNEVEAVFLGRPSFAKPEVINEPPVRKRKTANDAFDEASERRKKTRRKGGEGVAAAAASKSDLHMASLKHHRSMSIGQAVPQQTRPFSRSPSIASSRPPTAAAPAQKSSTLSRMQSATHLSENPTLESQNKNLISRTVMAGMRLHGFAQSKRRASRASSPVPSPIVDITFEEIEAERKNDEEYKLIYHQVFKGTIFAFRTSIDRKSLLPFAERVRDVVDQLLAIFCNDPLAQGSSSLAEKLTPGGRKAFATGTVEEHITSFVSTSKLLETL